MRVGLGQRRARERLLPGPKPVVDSLLSKPRLDAMLGENFRLRTGHIKEGPLQLTHDAPVKVLPLRPEEAFVRCVSYERVLEGITRVGRRAATKDELGIDQPVQGVTQLGLSGVCDTAANSG